SDLGGAKALRGALEEKLGPRGDWPADVCRALADALLEVRGGRGHDAAHELSWLRLVGWCLRPGHGAPGDRARMDTLWQVHQEGLRHPTRSNGPEWWILWRRVAPGLDRARQGILLDELAPAFAGPGGS